MEKKEKVNELLNTLYDMIEEARGGFGGTCRIDRDKALDILDDVRRVFPVELDESQRIMAQRAEYLANAERDADRIRKQAEEQARQMIDESEIQARVKAKATEILQETERRKDEMIRQAEAAASEATAKAEQRSIEQQQAANSYCDDVLRRTEEALNEALAEVQQTRSQFQAISGKEKGKKKTAYDAEKDS